MIAIEKYLTPSEATTWNTMIEDAARSGAQAVWLHSEAGLLFIGLLANGALETWFASPAATIAQAVAARMIVLGGLEHASHRLTTILSGADAIAQQAVKKAARH